MNRNLYIVAVVFNPFGFKSRYRLYENFKKHMAESGAKLFTVEAAFGDRDFVVTDPRDPMNLQVRTNQILWHKERLGNMGFRKLIHRVPDARYLGWYDSDVVFGNPDWVEEVTHKLTHKAVVQPFATAINLDSKGDYMWHCPSAIRAFIEGRGYHQEPPLPLYHTYKGHPGLAWNITREAWERIGGLYELCAAGSADTVMANAFKGDWSAFLPAPQTEAMKRSMAGFQEKTDKHIRGSLGFTHGCLLHHWHGRSENRGYEKRWSILSFHGFDPEVDIAEDDNGMLKWAGNKPRLEDDIHYSLSLRNEDEV